jgi:hypothetical protein
MAESGVEVYYTKMHIENDSTAVLIGWISLAEETASMFPRVGGVQRPPAADIPP